MNIKKFIKDRVLELHNVTWPTRKKAVHSMVVVLVIMALTALLLMGMDYIFKELILSFLS